MKTTNAHFDDAGLFGTAIIRAFAGQMRQLRLFTTQQGI
jgi:hypothetical protein